MHPWAIGALHWENQTKLHIQIRHKRLVSHFINFNYWRVLHCVWNSSLTEYIFHRWIDKKSPWNSQRSDSYLPLFRLWRIIFHLLPMHHLSKITISICEHLSFQVSYIWIKSHRHIRHFNWQRATLMHLWWPDHKYDCNSYFPTLFPLLNLSEIPKT